MFKVYDRYTVWFIPKFIISWYMYYVSTKLDDMQDNMITIADLKLTQEFKDF